MVPEQRGMTMAGTFGPIDKATAKYHAKQAFRTFQTHGIKMSEAERIAWEAKLRNLLYLYSNIGKAR